MIKKLFKTLLLVLPFVLVISACVKNAPQKDLLQVVQKRGKIIAGVKFDSPPFGFIDADQQLKGFDVELMREIAKRLLGSSDAVEFKQVTASNRIFSLSSGAIDVIAATMTITEARKQVVDFSETYYNAGQAIMVPKNSQVSNVKDLNGLRVAIVLGTTSEKNIRLLAPDAKIQGFRTYTDAYSAMKAGRVEAMTADDTIITGFLYNDNSFKMLNQRYTNEPYGLAFRKTLDTGAFQEEVNLILRAIKADGTLNKIRKKWMVESIK